MKLPPPGFRQPIPDRIERYLESKEIAERFWSTMLLQAQVFVAAPSDRDKEK